MIYEAATGSGKTEASLVASEILANKTARTGLFFALPSQATSNSMFSRINKWLSKHSEKTGESLPTRLIHGKAYLNEDFTRLRPASEIYENEDGEEAGLSVNSYFTGRKLAILDDFTVGTIDQVLLMALKQKHLMLKHLGLSNKVVIIDEVHSYDTYMSVYLDEALKWLGSYKVPVIILSATLPMDRRNDLLEAYLIGRYGKIRNMPRPENYENNRAYPLLTYNDVREILQNEDFSEAKKKSIAIKKIGLDEFDSIYSIVEKQRPHGGAIGIFVNTVRKAQEVARALMEKFSGEDVSLIHSAYIASHRLKKEKELIQLLGPGKNGKPNPNRPKFKVIVGTQVMEQSLDIDFDLIFTELAPIDLLIQRMGRLHRHKENIRPKNLENPQAYVLNAKDFNFDKGSGYVYKKKILMRTEYFLPDEIIVPDSVSDLVQDVYGKKEMEISEENRTIYEEYERSYESLVKRKEVKAGAFRIANPQQKIGEEKNISKWIANSNPSAEKFEENALAQVRDSLETLEVILLKEVKGGLSLIGSEDPITSLDKGVDKKIAQETIRLPAALCHGKCRDKERYKLDVLIEDLEDYYNENLSFWDDSTWLKGNLAMVLDEKGCYEFDGFLITYDEDRGLIYTRKE